MWSNSDRLNSLELWLLLWIELLERPDIPPPSSTTQSQERVPVVNGIQHESLVQLMVDIKSASVVNVCKSEGMRVGNHQEGRQ